MKGMKKFEALKKALAEAGAHVEVSHWEVGARPRVMRAKLAGGKVVVHAQYVHGHPLETYVYVLGDDQMVEMRADVRTFEGE